MADEQKLNGQAVGGGMKEISIQEVQQFVQDRMTEIAMSLPDFKFTLLGRNVIRPGQDIVLTIDKLDDAVATLQRYNDRQKASLEQKGWNRENAAAKGN